jgi:pseudaminic acid synthase
MLTLKQALLGSDADPSPFIIAEMSGNHNASLDKALAIVDAAAATGADALKIQTFTADSMTLDLDEGEFSIRDPNSLWAGKRLYDLYKVAQTPADWHKPIFDRAKEKGVLCFSTPFSEDAVDLLESLDAPAYKIASFELIDLPLVRYVASTKKPMIMSTGMATELEIAEAVDAARGAGCETLTLLQCTSSYPATPENTNLRTMPVMGQMFGCNFGLSDHTMGTGVAVAATALGASVIEKHFIIDRSEEGVDSTFSLEPDEFSALVVETERASQSMGEVRFGPTKSEEAGSRKRRSIYVCEDMKAGEVFTEKNIRRIRPGMGLPPKYYDLVLGRRATSDLRIGTPVTWDIVG